MGLALVRLTVIVVAAVSISSVAAYYCSIHHRMRAFAAVNIVYWCAAALLNAGVF
jgi:uncharacterized membrane protein